MKLSGEQNQALDKIHRWVHSSDDWSFKLGGYGGSGKTTLLQHFINQQSYPTLCCAPTGKAASVLSSKLDNIVVTTIHKLLYAPIDPDATKLHDIREQLVTDPTNEGLREDLDEAQVEFDNADVQFMINYNPDNLKGKLVIIDESSMVTEKIMKDLHDTGCKVLFVGDPGQLPPVKSRDWFAGQFNFVLQEVQRQALDSPIIRLSMDIRNGDFESKLRQYTTKQCRVVPQHKVKKSHLVKADQVITGMNMTRWSLNRIIRTKLDRLDALPMKGDKLMCTKNEYLKHMTYINGVQLVATSDTVRQPLSSYCTVGINYGGVDIPKVPFDYFECNRNYHSDIKQRPWYELQDMRGFDYGYAITAHKSQGSEWDYVIVVDDKMRVQDTEQRKRWLYTAVTRAKERLTLVY